MKVQFRVQPTSDYLRGRKRAIRRLKNVLRGTLVIDLSPINREFAN